MLLEIPTQKSYINNNINTLSQTNYVNQKLKYVNATIDVLLIDSQPS